MEDVEYAKMAEAEAGMWWYRALHARLLAALGPWGGPGGEPGGGPGEGPVLDAGCGTGGFLTCLTRHRPEVRSIGLEWHDMGARIAAGKSGRPIVRGSVNTLPFASGGFAAVVSADVLCHAAVDPVLALAEMRRVLRPGGRIVVNMPAFTALLSAHDAAVHNARRQTAAETRAMLEGAGLRVLSIRYWNGLLLPLMVLRRKVFAPSYAPTSAASSERSDVAAFPPWLDRIFHGVTELEQRLPFSLPAGGSVLAIAERT